MTSINQDIKKPSIGLIIIALFGLLILVGFLAYIERVWGPLFYGLLFVLLYLFGVWILFVGLLCGIVSALIGAPKGQGWLGFLFGVLLGPLGILIIVLTQGNRKACPYCKEKIHKDASVCPRCQREQILDDTEFEGHHPDGKSGGLALPNS